MNLVIILLLDMRPAGRVRAGTIRAVIEVLTVRHARTVQPSQMVLQVPVIAQTTVSIPHSVRVNYF